MDVSIVIPSYNGKRWLEICLPSIFDQDFEGDYEVILVENASSDGTYDYVARRFPQVRILNASTNLGYADGCNEGIRRAQGAFIVILNNDVELDKSWLASLVRAAREHPEYQLIASVDQFAVRRDFNIFLEVTGMRIIDSSDLVPSLFASGACFLIRREWIKALGRLFEPYFYFEDGELSLRSFLLGANIGYARSSRFQHFSELERSVRTPAEGRRKLRDAARFGSRHKIKSLYTIFSLSNFIKLLLVHLIYLIILCLSERDQILNLERIRGTFEGIPEIGTAQEKRRDFNTRKRRTDSFLFQRLLSSPSSFIQRSLARFLLG